MRSKQLEMVKLGLMIGIVTGILGVLFNLSIQSIVQLIKLYHPVPFQTRMLIAPILCGIWLGLIHKYMIKGDHYGFDVSGVMEEIRSIHTYLMKPVMVLAKLLATLITLAMGWSAGRQGPIVYIGGAVGSYIGYTFHYDREQIKILIACGVAGALSGVFKEPLFAVLFVLEVILHKDYLTYFAPVTISAIASALVIHFIGQDAPFVALEGIYGYASNKEWAFMVLLGFCMGLLAVVYIRTIKLSKKIFIKIESPVIKAVIAGVIIAGIGWFVPDIYDLHQGTISRIVSGAFSIKLLAVFIIAKLVTTGLTLSCGGVGGVFLPGLFIGSAAGRLFGDVLNALPFIHVDNAETYSVLGMVALFSGFANAPLSGTLLAMELVGQRELALPFLLTTVVASVVTEAVHKDSIYGHSNYVWSKNHKKEDVEDF